MGRSASIETARSRIPVPSARTRRLLPPLAGIVAGVLLIATGWTAMQVAGIALTGVALLLARGWVRVADAWWSDPVGQVGAWKREIRGYAPSWAWPAVVAVLLSVAAAVLGRQLVRGGEVNGRALGDLGKGVIALAMMATLALWSAERSPGRWGRWLDRWGTDARSDGAGEPEARADT